METPATLRQSALDYALAMPEAWPDSPWGDPVVKVRKKIFAFIGPVSEDGRSFALTVKLPTSGHAALELPHASPTGYGLGKSGWVSIRLTLGSLPPRGQILHWIWESYRAVAPKTLGAKVDIPE
ncbi:MAG: MmcQ/YjbR family DNA-binding protein [Myxococcales bacterium]|nr:MmcQ/YjbR family DNA-binding protein [Myxococcales bacterium]MCB9531936.1 MmcQ/YjbR family DNA-binding protein [Myxococcales bacterium]MCB9533904.1 MmcQ/YjbR family DNA-binding protein [Myxococcales bacterium]